MHSVQPCVRGLDDCVEAAGGTANARLIANSTQSDTQLIVKAPLALRISHVEALVRPPGRHPEDIDHRIYSETDGTAMTGCTLKGEEILEVDIQSSDSKYVAFINCSDEKQEQEGFVQRQSCIMHKHVHMQYSLDAGVTWSEPFKVENGLNRDPVGNGLIEMIKVDLSVPHRAGDRWTVSKAGDMFDISRKG